MEYTTLGRTGLKVSVVGMGAGGNSRLGLKYGKSPTEAADIVRAAFDMGITLVDTAPSYQTEEIVGDALKSVPRDSVVVSTKHMVFRNGAVLTPDEVAAGLDNSLKLMKTDYLDVFFLHNLTVTQEGKPVYGPATQEIVPRLLREKEKGKFRHLAVTAHPVLEPRHEGAIRGIDDDLFDVVMVAFSLINQTARDLVFPKTQAKKIGTMLMFVLRGIFDAEPLRTATGATAAGNPLDFAVHPGGATDLADAGYRFVRHEPGVDVVLTGTGEIEHLKHNIASILASRLPAPDHERLVKMFGKSSLP